jgi:phosphonate transport system substrate-binding protein
VLSSYEKGIKALVDGELDFARFGPASYILSQQQNPGISILAMESKKGKKTFSGIIAVQKDSPYLSGFTTLYHDFLKGQPETYQVIL